MKWTPEKIAQLRELAPTGLGSFAIGEILGTTSAAVQQKATKTGVRIADRRGVSHPIGEDWREPVEYVRARWSRLIGPMKEQLRADIGSM